MNKMYNICLLLYFRSFIAEMKFYVNKIRQSKSMIFWYFFFFNQFRGNMKLGNLLLILKCIICSRHSCSRTWV